MAIQCTYETFIRNITNLKSICSFACIASWTVLLLSCATPKTYQSFTDWDTSKDLQLDRKEFVNAYVNQNYFNNWSPNGMSLSQQAFLDAVFKELDTDRDGALSVLEFSTRIKSFYFGLFHDTFDKWDKDNNAGISRDEFKIHASASNLTRIWDTNSDQSISERELAGGMFYICDTDGNGYVNEIELDTWKRNQGT